MVGRSAAISGPHRVANRIRKFVDIVGDGKKKYTRLWDPLAASDKARTSFQPQLEKAAPAIPRYRPFSRLTETRQVPDCESIHLGVGAHEMAAASLECGGELRDSAGKC